MEDQLGDGLGVDDIAWILGGFAPVNVSAVEDARFALLGGFRCYDRTVLLFEERTQFSDQVTDRRVCA